MRYFNLLNVCCLSFCLWVMQYNYRREPPVCLISIQQNLSCLVHLGLIGEKQHTATSGLCMYFERKMRIWSWKLCHASYPDFVECISVQAHAQVETRRSMAPLRESRVGEARVQKNTMPFESSFLKHYSGDACARVISYDLSGLGCLISSLMLNRNN